MKSKYTYLIALLFILSVVISSCESETDSQFTFSGKLINGTTNTPYQNIKGNIYQISGVYPNVNTKSLGNSIYTNENGEFKFEYSTALNETGNIRLIFQHPINPFLTLVGKEGLPFKENIYKIYYVSDSGKMVLNFNSNNLLKSNEQLRIVIGTEKQFVYILNKEKLLELGGYLNIRTSYNYNRLLCQRISPDSTISESYDLNIQGDPFIDTIKINY